MANGADPDQTVSLGELSIWVGIVFVYNLQSKTMFLMVI